MILTPSTAHIRYPHLTVKKTKKKKRKEKKNQN